MTTPSFEPPRRTWAQKFRDAFRGLAVGVRGQSSFAVHLACAVAVVIAAAILQVTPAEWCLLILCIASVLVAEMFNRSLELLAKAIDLQENPLIRDALDIASGAVLVASAGAVAVGIIVFAGHLRALAP